MEKIFNYDVTTGNIELALPEILLVKEFSDLWEIERNKCEIDPTGESRYLANKEFKYIWLMCDWKSPYREDMEQIRHKAALEDSKLTDEEWEDELFRKAVRKYKTIKNSSKILNLIKTSYRTLEKLRIFLDNIDFEERDANDKPIYKAKDVLGDISSIGKMNDYLVALEKSYKDEQSSTDGKNRGGEKAGFGDE